jgi:hypothetical protein
MKIVPIRIIYALAAIITGVTANAKPIIRPVADGPPPPGVPPPGLPIDGGILILLAFALVFGLYKIYQFKLNQKTPT